MEDLQGKVAVITGGASGIGRAVAEKAAAEGMKIVIADIEEGPLKEAEGELTGQGAEAIGVVTDVSDAASVRELRDRALERFGAVHLVHNNAGIGTGRADLGLLRGGLALDHRGQPVGRHPRHRDLRAPAHGAGRGPRGQHRLHRRAHHDPVPRSLQRDQAGRRGHVRDALQGPADRGRRPSACRCSAPASCRPASPSRTGTGRRGRRSATSRAQRSCAP